MSSLGQFSSANTARYWADILGLPPGSVRQAGTVVVPHAKSRKGNFAHVFVRGATCVISVEEALVEDVRERAAGVPIETILTPNTLWTLFQEPIHRTLGPLFQGYAEREDFRPRFSDRVRPIMPGDEPRLRRLAVACNPTEWAHPASLMVPGTTDAQFFSRLGIQTYGFLPMKLPADFNFMQTIHAADERVPVDAVHFGTDAIYEVLQRYGR